MHREVGIAKGYHFNIDLLDRNPVTSGKHRKIPHHMREEVTTASWLSNDRKSFEDQTRRITAASSLSERQTATSEFA